MVSNDEDKEKLDWDKRNITRFAQYLYNLAKEKTLREKEKSVDEVILEKPVVESPEAIEERKIERKIALEEATIGLAKAVSGEDLEEVKTDSVQEENHFSLFSIS